MLDDVRFAVRGLLKAPGFTSVALVTLALGIAASTAGFSVLNAVLLRPLPYPDSDRLVILEGGSLSTNRFADWRLHTSAYDAFAAVDPGLPNVDTPEGPERIHSLLVSSDFVSMLGLRATAGRLFLPDDFRPDSTSVVITDPLARRLFGSPAASIGRVVHLVGTGYLNERYQVVGTMISPGPLPADEVSLLMPLLPLPRAELCPVIAHLKPGVSVAAARAEAEGVAAGFAASAPSHRGRMSVRVEPLKARVLGVSALTVRLVFGAALLVLLITCANVAHLVLARSTSRARDVAVRLALGASRARLAGSLLWESLLISLTASAAGLALADWALRLLVALTPYRVPRLADARVDTEAIVFTVVLAGLSAAAFALAPMAAARRLDLNAALKAGARGVAGSTGQRWFRSALVSTEIAVACVVLVLAGLLLETFVTLRPSNPGFDPHDKLILRIGNTAATGEDSIPLVADLQARIGGLPGVTSVAAATDLPLTGASWVPDVVVAGRSIEGGAAANAVNVRAVTANYLSAMRTPVVAGRDFDRSDMAQRLPVAVVNQEFVRRFLGGMNPLGQHVVFAGGRTGDTVFAITGVARDVRMFGDSVAARPELYVPFAVAPARGFYLVVASSGDPAAAAASVRALVRDRAPGAVITNLQTMDQLLLTSVAEPRFHAWLFGVLAGLAVVLALAGIHAVLSYSVAMRRHEMGLRVALGAATGDILRLVLGGATRVALAGLLIGLPAAFVASRAAAALLYGIGTADPLSYACACAVLLALALAAALVPALRAARVDPLGALRAE